MSKQETVAARKTDTVAAETVEREQRSRHPFRMWEAIEESPDAVRNCLEGEPAEAARQAGRKIIERGIGRVFLLGCGSSNYAAISSSYALTQLAGIDADAYDAFEFNQYRIGHSMSRTAVFAFSHSGETKVTVDAARLLRSTGAFTVAVTDRADSRLATEAQCLVPVGGGIEPVEPKTRSYISALVIGYQIAAAVRESYEGRHLNRIAGILEQCLTMQTRIRRLAQEYAGVKRVVVVGGGPNYATALETALKFKEAVLLAAEGLEIEEAFHGPIASLGRDTLVIGVSVPGPSYDKVGHFLKAATIMGCPTISVTSRAYGLENADELTVGMGEMPEVFSNAVLIFPLYIFAYYSALARGNNPDIFRFGDDLFRQAITSVPSISYGR